jgi:hypothetical protein
LAALCAASLSAQEFRSTISGAVSDPTGSGIPNAKIVVTETHTGTRVLTTTDAARRLCNVCAAHQHYSTHHYRRLHVMNHPTFAAPNTTATNTAFGTINAQANRTRTIQLGARFIF